MAKRPSLSDTQIMILQHLHQSRKKGLTRQEISDAVGFSANGSNLGPTYTENREAQPNSLVSRKMVKVYQLTVKGEEHTVYMITKSGIEAAKKHSVLQQSNGEKIPSSVIDPAVKRALATRNHCLERFTDEEIREIRKDIGGKYKSVSIDNLREQAVNRRKQGAYKDTSDSKRKIRSLKRLEKEFGVEGTTIKLFLTGKQILQIDKTLSSLQQT